MKRRPRVDGYRLMRRMPLEMWRRPDTCHRRSRDHDPFRKNFPSCYNVRGVSGRDSGGLVSVTGGSQPPLRRIHSDQTLQSGSSKYSLDYWRKQSTSTIVDSLRPGRSEALKVKPDGRIMDGNT